MSPADLCAEFSSAEVWYGSIALRDYDRWWRMADMRPAEVHSALGTAGVAAALFAAWTSEQKARALVRLRVDHAALVWEDERFDRWIRR